MHANAFGQSIKISNIDKLVNYANKELANINFNEGYYEADFIVNGNCSYLTELVKNISENKNLWGQGCEEPIIIIENLPIEKNNIQIIGTNKDTVKFIFNNMTFIKFKAQDFIEQINKNNQDKIIFNVVGRANENSFRGNITQQLLIDDIEILENNEYYF